MSYPCHIHEKAHEEYMDAFVWYELNKVGLGKEFMECVEKKIKDICSHPETYGTKHHLKYREAKVSRFPYSIVYEFFPRKKIIKIIAIHHLKRDPHNKYLKK